MTEPMLIPLHSRVALREGADSVYAFAVPGSEGHVRDYKVDDEGFQLVMIEWDKEHWRYNNQPDGWTFLEHFKIIGPPEPPEEPLEANDVPSPDSLLPASDVQVENYIDALSTAMEAASEGEGFMVLVVRKMPNPDNPQESIYLPQIYTHSVSQEASLLLDIQLAECAATNYEEMIASLIERLKRGH